jgi:hypothetical protein
MQSLVGSIAVGGSAAVRPTRNRRPAITQKDKDLNALNKAIEKLGEIEANNVQAAFGALSKSINSDDWDIGNGIIVSLLQQNLSYNEIRQLLGVGSSRIKRIKDDIKNPDRLCEKVRSVPWHAATEADIQRIRDCYATWELEDGFPCAHRRPRKYFVREGQRWKVLWADYQEKTTAQGHRVMSLPRWTQYIKYLFPGLRLSRSKEDVCDACVRIEIQLSRLDLTEAERQSLQLEKSMHLDAAVGQRRAMNGFVRAFIEKECPDQRPPTHILPDEIESDLVNHHNSDQEADAYGNEVDQPSEQRIKVQVQAEDFGGSLTMPHYGYQRPSADYFNSNLLIQNFVIADITGGRNNIFFLTNAHKEKTPMLYAA